MASTTVSSTPARSVPATSAPVSAAPETAPLLTVRDLTIRYRTPHGLFTAVDSFSLTMRPGTKVAVVGESGSGKTNACMAVAGFLAPDAIIDAGALNFDGQDLTTRRRSAVPQRIDGVAVVFQDAMTSLDPVWTIGQQLTAVIRNTERAAGGRKPSRAAARAAAAAWLTKVGLTDTDRVMAARPYELSGGMRQRVMIAIALSGSPRLLIADEPTSALDATLSRELMQLMVALSEDVGAGLLMVSHDIALCQEFTDWTVVMNKGRIVEEGPSGRLAETATHPYTRGLIACIPTLEHASASRLPTMASVATEPLAPSMSGAA
ncbi:ABC transporter ATP-binding protein [Nocardia higoensis]|uniref:ABC transporter ATP-binding protein n=1 Tax=Nocardia higoensis TaxID=228599 RepID=UPI000688017D|nr:ABC transporter ATP-binding protein [Nocardia higoensis]